MSGPARDRRELAVRRSHSRAGPSRGGVHARPRRRSADPGRPLLARLLPELGQGEEATSTGLAGGSWGQAQLFERPSPCWSAWPTGPRPCGRGQRARPAPSLENVLLSRVQDLPEADLPSALREAVGTFATWPGLLETFGRLEAAAGLALEGAELAASQGAGALARPVPDRDCPRSAVRARPLGRRRGAAGSRGRPGRLELAATWVYLSAPSPARDLRQLRHPQVPGRSRLGAQALPRRTALQADLGVLAQPGRGVLLQFSDEALRLIDSLDRHPLQA
jgi:hypothetical protein